MHDYLLTIRIPFKSLDDVDARQMAQELIQNSTIAFKGGVPEYKLQRLNLGKPPDNVNLFIDTKSEKFGPVTL